MELFAKIVNGLKPLTIFAKKLHLRYLSGSNHASDIIIICNFIQVYTLPTEIIKTILKAFVKFAGALCPFVGGYFKKQTSGRVAHWDRDNLFSTFAKFSEKLTFLTPRYALGAAKFLMKKAIPLLSFSLHFFHHFLLLCACFS